MGESQLIMENQPSIQPTDARPIFHPTQPSPTIIRPTPHPRVSPISTGDNWEPANGQQRSADAGPLQPNNALVLRGNAALNASMHWFYDNAILRPTGKLLQFHYEVLVHCWRGASNATNAPHQSIEMFFIKRNTLRIGYLVGNPDPYQCSELPTSIREGCKKIKHKKTNKC